MLAGARAWAVCLPGTQYAVGTCCRRRPTGPSAAAAARVRMTKNPVRCLSSAFSISGADLFFQIFWFVKYIYILALEMASPGDEHCASCIGTLSFPV